MWYMLNVYFNSALVVGDFSINMIRLISAITLHIMILPEATQGVKLIKVAILYPRHEGRSRQFLIGFFQAFTSFGTETLNLLFMCTQS